MAKTYTIRQYAAGDYDAWNTFIDRAKNATFLFHRDYMDYHADRFLDHSLMVFDGTELVCVLPAHVSGHTLHSHRGLTYGGFVFEKETKLATAIQVVAAVMRHLNHIGLEQLYIKPIPAFYCTEPSAESQYCMFVAEARLVRRDCLSVIDRSYPFSYSRKRRQALVRGTKNGLEIREDGRIDLFWEKILIPNLAKKHSAKPVHTAEEMSRLKARFPQHIRHFNVYHQNEIVAGSTIFSMANVAHPQYISGNDRKNELGSLDFLYDYLIRDVYADKQFFDFGPSHEDEGRKINEGMLFWKESFGARSVIQDFYEVDTRNYVALENVMI